MNAYGEFAAVYDSFMEDIEYEEWTAYIISLWKEQKSQPHLVLDLGCGTGGVSLSLAKLGYEVIGVDISEDMLAVAEKKADALELSVLFLAQDMRELELYGTVDAVVSLCDSLNYMTESEALEGVFRLVNLYLNPKGLFIFDLNTPYKFEHILADNNFGACTEQAAYIWENYYDKQEKVNEFYLNFFIREENGQTYRRAEECHYERAYEISEVAELLEKAGMELLHVYDAYTKNPPRPDSERLFYIARENGK